MAKDHNPTLEASADSDAALLAKFGFSELPATFAMREPGGAVIQEREPCYQCRADGFYGRGRAGTLYQEGDIIVMSDTPNQHLEPLNRSAMVRQSESEKALAPSLTFFLPPAHQARSRCHRDQPEAIAHERLSKPTHRALSAVRAKPLRAAADLDLLRELALATDH